MNKTVPTRALPEHPDLDQLRRQAKDLLSAFLVNDVVCVAGSPNCYAAPGATYGVLSSSLGGVSGDRRMGLHHRLGIGQRHQPGSELAEIKMLTSATLSGR